VLTTTNAAGTNGLTCLSRHRGARNIFGHPSDDRPLRILLSFCDCTLRALTAELLRTTLTAGTHMTVAGINAYKFLAYATYLHVYALTGIPVSATQVDSTTFDLLTCNLREGTRGPRNRHVSCRRYARTQMACKCNLQMYPHCASNLHITVNKHASYCSILKACVSPPLYLSKNI
jgi:hypothetical protein